MSKKGFNRGIDCKFVAALNKEYANESWWKKLILDKSLFLGIRDSHVHLYFKGGRILELKNTANGLIGKTHFKYLINSTRNNSSQDYVKFKNGDFDKVRLDNSYRDVNADLERIKRAANTYQGDEKKGVHEIIMDNMNVIDTEIELPGERRRIDFAAVQKINGRMTLVFFEAKTYSNDEIRSQGRPEVLSQIEAYEDIICRRKSEIEGAYRQVADNICAIHGWSGRRSDIFRDVVTNGLLVDPKVRLVIFGFDGAQKKEADQANGVFAKLREYLGENLVLTKGNTDGFVKGIRSVE